MVTHEFRSAMMLPATLVGEPRVTMAYEPVAVVGFSEYRTVGLRPRDSPHILLM